MKRFLKHLLYLLLLVPILLIVVLCTHCELQAEVVDEFTLIYELTVTEADGTEYREKYEYNPACTLATVSFYENDVLVRTEERQITEADHRSPFEGLDHPTATAARCEKEQDGSTVTVHWFDADDNPEGWSEMTYNYNDILGRQIDYAPDGTVLRTTLLHTVTHQFKAIPTEETTSPIE